MCKSLDESKCQYIEPLETHNKCRAQASLSCAISKQSASHNLEVVRSDMSFL